MCKVAEPDGGGRDDDVGKTLCGYGVRHENARRKTESHMRALRICVCVWYIRGCRAVQFFHTHTHILKFIAKTLGVVVVAANADRKKFSH